MLESTSLPDHVAHVRTTPVFTAVSVPAGLRRAHRIAPGVWGRLRVIGGSVTFVLEDAGESRDLHEGDTQVIEPDVAHHVEPGANAEFVIEFYR